MLARTQAVLSSIKETAICINDAGARTHFSGESKTALVILTRKIQSFTEPCPVHRFESKRSSGSCISFSFFLSPFPTAFYFDLFFLLIRFPTPRISSLATGQAKNGICRFPREKQRKRSQQEISSYSKPRLAFSRCTLESVSHETSRIIAFRNSKAKCFRPGGPRGL